MPGTGGFKVKWPPGWIRSPIGLVEGVEEGEGEMDWWIGGCNGGRRALAVEVEPDDVGGADGAAGIPGGGGEIHFFERGTGIDLAIGHGVHRATTGQSQVRAIVFFVKGIQEGKEGLLVHGLGGTGDVFCF